MAITYRKRRRQPLKCCSILLSHQADTTLSQLASDAGISRALMVERAIHLAAAIVQK